MILAGDIGGTHSRLCTFKEERGHLLPLNEKTFRSCDHKSLQEIVDLFLRGVGQRVDCTCLAIAGPVLHGRAQATNLPWIADAAEIARQFGIRNVWLINDLEAHATGIADLEAADLANLDAAVPRKGNAALIAAGTGLGEAGMFWDGTRHRAFAAEGGHADWAPRNELEIALHQYLSKKFGHVSCERVVSGPGLENVYDFLRDSQLEKEPDWLRDELAQAADPAATISQRGLEASVPICERALDIFVAAYGAEAGNLALRMLATAGVFVSGGIAGKILPKLCTPLFRDAFEDKGRLKPLLETIPVKVITNARVGLIGAARYAVNRVAEEMRPRAAS
ncbi:MAG TPA: glucokinase [Candidatus Angelobacter sp.]|nr:glucokinase [Candidatus Angelobacter sp.]